MKKTFSKEIKLYTICIFVENMPGIISQVSRLFARKGYNIESIVSGETEVPNYCRVSIEVKGDQLMVEQLAAQCRKLLPVRAVKIYDEDTCIRREIALIKVTAADRAARSEIIQLVNIFGAQILDAAKESLIIWIFGTPTKTSALIELLSDYNILEIAKTGTIAIERGRGTIHDEYHQEEITNG